MDQPALAPLLARVSLSLFGVSAEGLRLWSAVAAAGTVVVGGLTAREFGGARRAQLLAANATGTMPVLLGSAHVADTTSYEVLAWAAIAFVVVRIGRTGAFRERFGIENFGDYRTGHIRLFSSPVADRLSGCFQVATVMAN
ncbi:glycosyltransferase family 39 protein [Streptomyces sp. MI02-2A]|uniref:glycosyltransferase family 39 protein n=1 Tax=unclassified Streptomyces TaxID=2593676 RepID=UPI002689FD87|nr:MULTISPECIES: glycosyltransferase family 39 protein [unclassified Streptomyces]MDX3262147.1 glycosyltransferase family 39 protein [Streptomyces sp. MI02-2A]